jgi:hypothetical protein
VWLLGILSLFIRSDEAAAHIQGVSLHACSAATELSPDVAAGTLLSKRRNGGPGSAHARQGDPLMTESLPSAQRHITTATGMPTCLNRPGGAPADAADGRAGVESVLEPAVAAAPILITEQEVLLSTAAAVRVSSKKTAEQWIALLRSRRLFMHSGADEPAAKHRHYPRHYVFLEQALMGREMDRL